MPSYLVQRYNCKVYGCSEYLHLTDHSSDVLDDARVNVIDETTNRVVWYKVRFVAFQYQTI